MSRQDLMRRTGKKREQRRRFLVVVEGGVTEREYVEAVKRLRRFQGLDIMVEHEHTDPIGIVRYAKNRQRAAKRIDPYDEVWCVFDTETRLTQIARPGLADALCMARDAKIRCAISNPCIELWLLWHRCDQTAWISSDDVQRRCREEGITQERHGKHVSDAANLLASGYTDAKFRAEAAEANYTRNGIEKPEEKNPSSGMYQLVDSIYAASSLPRN